MSSLDGSPHTVAAVVLAGAMAALIEELVKSKAIDSERLLSTLQRTLSPKASFAREWSKTDKEMLTQMLEVLTGSLIDAEGEK